MNRFFQCIEPGAKIKVFIVTFDFELKRREIPAFRAAIVEKVGRENVLFHNHMQTGLRYGYPLIQYKIFRRYPAVVCINQGTEEILKFFEQTDWHIVLSGKEVDTQIKDLRFDYFRCEFRELPVKYRMQNWFALNEDNFQRFVKLTSDSDKYEFLQRILIGNIISFAKGIHWNLDQQLRVTVARLHAERFFNFKDHKMAGFDLDFSANVLLPDAIGLGKSVSRGFGVIRKVG